MSLFVIEKTAVHAIIESVIPRTSLYNQAAVVVPRSMFNLSYKIILQAKKVRGPTLPRQGRASYFKHYSNPR